jgi:hypothetical protein
MIAKILTMLLGLTLVVLVACGTAEEPAPTSPPAAEPTAAPASGQASQPTATPQAAAPPAEAKVSSETITIMIGDFASERFDYTFNVPAQ